MNMAPCACCSSAHDAPQEPYINPSNLILKCPLDNERKRFTKPMVGPDIEGRNRHTLQGLPVEIYQACLQHLDMQLLTDMRRVSQFTRSAIDSLYQYKEIYDHAPGALRACLSTGVAPRIPLLRLHNSLTSMECRYCATSDPPESTFGTHLSLFTCDRICTFCARNNPLLRPLELKTLLSLALLKNSTLRFSIPSIPLLKPIPGHYTPEHTLLLQRPSLFLTSSLTPPPGKEFSEKERRVLQGNERTAIINHHPLLLPSTESDITPNASENHHSSTTPLQKAFLYATVLPFPYLPPSKAHLDAGLQCEKCNLHLQFVEYKWKKEQQNRRRNFQDPTASLRRRELINAARKMTSAWYGASQEAEFESNGKGMSIYEHEMVHVGETLSDSEWRFMEKMKKPVQNGENSSAGG